MQKLEGKSIDLIQERVKKLKELFPEVCLDGKIDFDHLRLLLGENVESETERYQFTWNGKKQAIQLALKQTTGTLRPCPEESLYWETTQNLYIEGDNLEVLRLLQLGYRQKIKMIYIDPPYNTGKDFIYQDDFHDHIKSYTEKTKENLKSNPETEGRYHTDWLNMIYPRILLARNLLRDDGVLFISIDDHELANLRKVCDEIFGEENFLGIFVVNSTPNGRDYGHIAKMHEYVLFYAKKACAAVTYLLPDPEKSFKYCDQQGEFNIHPLYNSNVAFHRGNRPNLYYPFYLNPNERIDKYFYPISLEKQEGWLEVFPPKSVKDQVQFVWRWGKEKARKGLNSEIIGFRTKEGEYRIVQKMRHKKKRVRSLLLEKAFASRKGTAEVEEIFGAKIFSFPKPLQLIETFLKVGADSDAIILDFFSGSATTAHAVMKLNAEDRGQRQFILVQFPEPLKGEKIEGEFANICEIGKERIRRAGQKIRSENEGREGVEQLDIGFRVFKLDTSNLKSWNEETNDLERELLEQLKPIKAGRTAEDVVYEIMIKEGFALTVPLQTKRVAGVTVYLVGEEELLICLERDLTLHQIEAIVQSFSQCSRMVFDDEGFQDDIVRLNAEKIFCRYGVNDLRVI